MHADTDAIRSLGSATAGHADELAAIASSLASLPIAAATSAFGPVAGPYLAALADAVAAQARAVTALGERSSTAGLSARASATAYDDADARAGARVSGR